MNVRGSQRDCPTGSQRGWPTSSQKGFPTGSQRGWPISSQKDCPTGSQMWLTSSSVPWKIPTYNEILASNSQCFPQSRYFQTKRFFCNDDKEFEKVFDNDGNVPDDSKLEQNKKRIKEYSNVLKNIQKDLIISGNIVSSILEELEEFEKNKSTT